MGDWTRWLTIAATCAGVTSSDRLAVEQSLAEEIETFLVNSGRYRIAFPGWVENKVTVGQHAGMLILRDTFVRQLERSRLSLLQIQSDEEILAFRRMMEPGA